MRVLFAVPLLLLVAAAQAQLFDIVPGKSDSSSVLYNVRGVVTVGTPSLTSEKSALEYQGDIAIQQLSNAGSSQIFFAQFKTFQVQKYETLHATVEDDSLESSEEAVEKETTDYLREMRKPVKVYFKDGEVVRYEAQQDQKEWAINIYRAVFTLLQNQVDEPKNVHQPKIQHYYEDGISGNCKVQYEVLSQPEYNSVHLPVYNVTKTKYLKDCKEPRPVYLHLKEVTRGCPGVCTKHQPENFMSQYEEQKSDHEMLPTPGCPVNRRPTDTIVTVHEISQYNITQHRLEEAQVDTIDIYRLFAGDLEVRTRLSLELKNTHGPQVEQPKSQLQQYTSLQYQLPEEADLLDIPIYSLMLENGKVTVAEHFNKHLERAVQELQQLGQQTTDDLPENIASYVAHMIQAMSLMNVEQIRKTIPQVVEQKKQTLQNQQQHIKRQLWLDVLSKGGSKASVIVAVELIKKQVLTQGEARHILQDIAAFNSFTDKKMVEEVMQLCLGQQTKLSPATHATACAAAGQVISKACRSAVHQEPYTQKRHQQAQKNMHQGQQANEESSEESQEESMSRLSIDAQQRCDIPDLKKYIQQISKALQEARNYKEIVAYINALSKIAKPEVLPELQQYVDGVARNLKNVVEKDEDEEEAIDFIRQVAILSLQNVVEKYPKEVNPIVRVIFQNLTESVQTRLVAFDVWTRSQPAQWEIKKVLLVAKNDESLELTNYVYTALKHLSRSEEPCNRLFARRIRDAWAVVRPSDLGMEYSHLYAGSFYDRVRDHGVAGFWKLIASNSSNVPTYSAFETQMMSGPFRKTILSAKLLIKGSEQFKEEILGNDGLLDRLADAVDGKVRQGQRKEQQQRLLKDIAKDLKFADRDTEIPKAVYFWRFFSGETIIPVDRHYVEELKTELLQHVHKWGKNGISAHIVRVIVPTKAYHVEPSSVGLPVVHYTIHPIVLSLKLENVQIQYDNIDSRITPEKVELKGIFHPTVLSLRQSRLFVADVEGQKSPAAIVSSVKEFNFRAQVHIKLDTVEQKLKLRIKPHFDRIAHIADCVEITLDENLAIESRHPQDWLNYDECVKTMPAPFRFNKQIGGKRLGMTLKLNATSHHPWSGLPIFASRPQHRFGVVATLLKKLANQGFKHRVGSLFLKQYNQEPINEWAFTVDLDDNLHELARQSLQQQSQQSQKASRKPLSAFAKSLFDDSSSSSSSSESQESLERNSGVQDILQRVERLVQKNDEIEETVYQRQIVWLLEGFHQGQLKKSYRAALKKVSNFERTSQNYAFVIESQQSHKRIEVHGNVSYPNIDTPFNYDPIYFDGDEMNATFVAHYFDKNTKDQKFVIEFNATKTEEQHVGIQNFKGLRQNKWFQTRCLAEQKNGHEVSDACRKANIVDNYLDQMQLTVTYPEKVSPRLEQWANKLLTLIKYKYWAHAKSEIVNTEQNLNNQVVVYANATRVSPWSLLYDVEVNMPEENLYLDNIRIRGVRPPHMQMTTKQIAKEVIFKGHKDHPCGLGERTVKTYDNVSFPLDVKSHCEYVLTRDCSGTPDFTVTFEVLDKTVGSKKLNVQLYNTVIQLTPPEYQHEIKATVVVNGTVHHIVPSTPLSFYYGKNYKVFVYVSEPQNVHEHPVLFVRTENKYFTLHYDGYSAFVYVDSHYKGDTCGICGNNDNEPAHEFIGPHGEEYDESNEFIASYGIGSECQHRPVHSTRQQMIQDLEQDLEQQSMKDILREQQLKRSQIQGRRPQVSSNWDIKRQQHSSGLVDESREQRWDSSEESQEQRRQNRRQQMRSQNKMTSSEEESQYLRQRRQQQDSSDEYSMRLRQDSSEERRSQKQWKSRQQKLMEQRDSSEEQQAEEQKDCIQERTILRNLPSQICFSKRPVVTCSNKCRKVKSAKKEQVEFTCMLKEDAKAKKLVRQLREQGVVEEVQRMPVSMVEPVRVPEKCVRA